MKLSRKSISERQRTTLVRNLSEVSPSRLSVSVPNVGVRPLASVVLNLTLLLSVEMPPVGYRLGERVSEMLEIISKKPC